MVAGLLGLGGGAVAFGSVGTFPVLVAVTLLYGGAYASAMPATNRAITVRAPPGQYNLAIGVKQVGVTGGSAIAAVLVTNADAAGLGWQSAFYGLGGLAILVAVGFALTYEGADGFGDPGLPDLGALRGDRTYLLLAGSGLFLGASIFATTGYVVPYFEGSLGASLRTAGFVLAGMQLTGSAGRIVVGSVADRLPGSDERSALGVMAVQTLAGAAVLLALPGLGVTAAIAAAVVLGVAMLGGTGLYHGTLVVLVDDDASGAATAGGQATINVGGLLAPPLFGLLADGVGYATAWTVMGCSLVVSAILLGAAWRSTDA
ncbi:MFS transporter [Haloarculaceae archaeon H-GB2-1]|nr:MFS transporter [Haloarculaceae archaeon H-GB2-1]